MEKKVMSFMMKHDLLKRDTTVLIGVSGGPDSMALLHFFVTIRNDWNLRIVALSADHRLRGEESRNDLRYVKEICKEWQIELVTAALDVKQYKNEYKVGTQVAAREVRYQFYEQQMNAFQANFLVLGHHGDDQVETMLMGFARSASTTALSGIPMKRKFACGYIVRPFLSISKKDILMYCKKEGIHPRIDTSNEDTDYTRNFFRKHVIPKLYEQNNNIHVTVQRLSEVLQEDEHFLQREAKKLFENIVRLNKKEKIATIRIDDLKLYPRALQRRIYHLILNCLYDEVLPKNLSYTHEDMFFSLFQENKRNVHIHFPNHLIVEVSYNDIIFSFRPFVEEEKGFYKLLEVPGKLELLDGSTIQATCTSDPVLDNKYTYTCHINDVALPLYVKTRQPGDRMSWKGLMGSKKIKDIFIDEKIPRKYRDKWPIVTDKNGMILWLVGLRKANEQKNKENNGTVFLQLIYEEGKK